jgi:hypothetical protein
MHICFFFRSFALLTRVFPRPNPVIGFLFFIFFLFFLFLVNRAAGDASESGILCVSATCWATSISLLRSKTAVEVTGARTAASRGKSGGRVFIPA